MDLNLVTGNILLINLKICLGSPIRNQLSSQSILHRRKKFVALKTVLSLSGFGIDPASGVPTAPKAVMDAYIEAHPKKAFIFTTSEHRAFERSFYWEGL